MGRPDQARGKAGAGMRMSPNCGKNVEISFCPYYTDTRMKNGTTVYGFFKWEQAPFFSNGNRRRALRPATDRMPF